MTPVKNPSDPKKRTLTEVELELMTILWKISEATVHEVLPHLAKDRKLAYTSVSTILRILEQKKIIGSRKDGRGHIYYPLLSKADYEKGSVKRLVETVFAGAPSAMVRQLLDSTDLTREELKELQELLNSKMKEGRSK